MDRGTMRGTTAVGHSVRRAAVSLAVLLVLAVVLFMGLSATALAATMNLYPSGPVVTDTALSMRNSTSNWEAVADSVDNTNVYNSGGWLFDIYDLPDVSSTATGTISRVSVRIYVRAVATVNQNSARTYLRIGGTDYTDGFQVPTDDTWDWRVHNYDTNPATGLAWTWADIDALQAGVGLRDSDSTAATSETRCTRVNIRITYNNEPDLVGDIWTILEDSGTNTFDPRTNDTDADGDTLTITGVSAAAHGTAGYTATSLTYVPTADYFDPPATHDLLWYWVDDGTAPDTHADVYVIITPVNDEPQFTAGGNQTVDEDCGAQTVAGWATGLSAGPANESDQTLTFHVSSTNAALFAVDPALDPVTGTLTYTPADNANGSALVSVYLTDDGGTADGGDDTSPTQTFTITVNAVNDAPVAVNDPDSGSYTTHENTPLVVAAPGLLANDSDVDGDPLSAVISIGPVHGSLGLSGDGSFTYTPTPGYYGSDSFTYVAYDGTAYSAAATVSITVIAVWTITPSAGLHGWITPSLPVDVVDGDDYTFFIHASAGYHVADVLVDGVSVGAVTSYTFHGVHADHTISVTFALNWGTSIWGRPGLRR